MTHIHILHTPHLGTQALRWLGIAVFASVGVLKLAGHPIMASMFDEMRFGAWAMYAVGIAEIAGAILLLMPRWIFIGALGLTVLMCGAVATDIAILHRLPILSVIMCAAMILLAWRTAPAKISFIG